MLHVVNCLVIEAQIPTKEDLQNNMPIQFPTFNNKSTDLSWEGIKPGMERNGMEPIEARVDF